MRMMLLCTAAASLSVPAAADLIHDYEFDGSTSWVMMLGGFGLTGTPLRSTRRKRAVA